MDFSPPVIQEASVNLGLIVSWVINVILGVGVIAVSIVALVLRNRSDRERLTHEKESLFHESRRQVYSDYIGQMTTLAGRVANAVQRGEALPTADMSEVKAITSVLGQIHILGSPELSALCDNLSDYIGRVFQGEEPHNQDAFKTHRTRIILQMRADLGLSKYDKKD